MITYGEVHSNIRPEDIDVRETMVFVATDIEEDEIIYSDSDFSYEQEEDVINDQKERGYKYNLIGYDKNEYIRLISTKNKQLENELANAQMALCELYELVEVL